MPHALDRFCLDDYLKRSSRIELRKKSLLQSEEAEKKLTLKKFATCPELDKKNHFFDSLYTNTNPVTLVDSFRVLCHSNQVSAPKFQIFSTHYCSI